MNGRAFDYNLGRFLSVDPFIQAPGNSQSFNPYSYIMNNPLAGTDPSGYRWDGDHVAGISVGYHFTDEDIDKIRKAEGNLKVVPGNIVDSIQTGQDVKVLISAVATGGGCCTS